MAAPEQSKQIMISYQWDSQKDVLRIKETLDKLGYKVWMDIDQMRGNIYQKMSEGVENSDVIVVCMSAKYQTSECCNRELQYAQDMRKKIIPIKIEKGYVPHGALGLIVSGALYVDFSDPLKFDEKFSALLGEINNSLGVQDNRKIESTAHEHRQKSNSGKTPFLLLFNNIKYSETYLPFSIATTPSSSVSIVFSDEG